MAKRPAFIDVRSQSHGPLGSSLPSPRPLTSPRLHVAGDVPPELSPLDAFAAQSRLLSKQLEGSVSGGKRMSRLPPLTTEGSFITARPGFLRSILADDSNIVTTQYSQSPKSGLETELEVSPFRPVSIYPFVSSLPPSSTELTSPRLPFQDDEEQFRGRRPATPRSDFGTRVEQSPSPLGQDTATRQPRTPQTRSLGKPSVDSMRQPGRTPDNLAIVPRGLDTRALVPPRSPFAQKAPSALSTSVDDSDEDFSFSMGASLLSESRKLSTSSGLSTSPISPLTRQAIPRSPSVGSDISACGSRPSRPAFNFSRPLSRASGPPVTDVPSRQASSDSQPFILDNDTAHLPVSMTGEEFSDASNAQTAVPSYVYSRFTLPRGKVLQRNSQIFQENPPPAEFWGGQLTTTPHSNAHSFPARMMATPPSPPERPSTYVDQASSTSVAELVSGRHSGDQSNSPRDRIPNNQGGSSAITNVSQGLPPPPSTSRGTTKAQPQHSLLPSTDCSVEEHVSRGIECHERGSLNESTYHLRIAARQNHPTGMLLYALACRHGWGMRPNQQVGVHWLRKAVDFAFLEVADADLLKEGRPVDLLEQKTRKAQFALSIYELGVSHMNGWGIEQDKALALRCFEIAGAWGDGDALAEAGFCYARGIGCKKDLKKSATFYRLAESKGISMVGNSWIYKSKYKDDSTERDKPDLSDKKGRNKSRTRTIFGKII